MSTHAGLHRRRTPPLIPPRPEGVGPESFHGSQFDFFDDIGFVAGKFGPSFTTVQRVFPVVRHTSSFHFLRGFFV